MNFKYGEAVQKSFLEFNMARLLGSNQNDTIKGYVGLDTIKGYAGDDKLNGNAGNDTIQGGDGNDLIFGGGTDSRLVDDDKIFGDEGNDTLDGDLGNDRISGGSGNDRIFGDFGSDTISGGSGNDMIYDAQDNSTDIIYGNSGADRFEISTIGTGYDIIKDFSREEGDTFFFSFGKASDFSVDMSENKAYIYGGQELVAIIENVSVWDMESEGFSEIN